MYKLTLVSLFALSSLVFAIPQPVPDKIDELGKRSDYSGTATIFYPYTGPCDNGTGELYSVAISSIDHNLGTIPCPGIPVDVLYGTKTVGAMITNYCDISCGVSVVDNSTICNYGCKGDNIEINTQLFQQFANTSEGYIQVTWSYQYGQIGRSH